MKNSVVLGWGTVGKATALAFDIEKHYSHKESNVTLEEAANYRYIFICLPTPTIEGKVFTDDIQSVINQIKQYQKENIFIIRSTVPPGFNRQLQTFFGGKNYVSNPEFLSEKTSEYDALHPVLIVIGSEDINVAQEVAAIYKSRYKYIEPLVTDSITAELIKYTLNNFFSVKIMFANEVFDYAQKVGANYEVIRRVLEGHPWGSKNHFKVWYNERRGIHGKCLPKDLEAFSNITRSPFFEMVHKLNGKYK